MKLATLLGGFLLITFGGHAETRDLSSWEDDLSANLDRMEADAERREEEAEAREEQLEAEAEAREERLEAKEEAREERLEAEEEAREKQLEAEEEAKEKQFQVELAELKQKCAKKGFSNDTDGYSNRMVTSTNSIDGFRHIYVQTYNSTTKKVSGSYYSISEKDPKAEPICGKLVIEPTSDDPMSQKSEGISVNFSVPQNEKEIVEFGQKCAARGFPYDNNVGSERMEAIETIIDGIRHIYLQTYNSATKKVSGSYFRIDRNGQLTCGKLKIESTS